MVINELGYDPDPEYEYKNYYTKYPENDSEFKKVSNRSKLKDVFYFGKPYQCRDICTKYGNKCKGYLNDSLFKRCTLYFKKYEAQVVGRKSKFDRIQFKKNIP